MTILITGANGMLGEECVKLLSRQHNIIATDQQDGLTYKSDVTYQILDITDRQAIARITEKYQPETVINCAAFTDVDGSEIQRESAWKVNAGGVENLIAVLQNTPCRLIHISTDYVFDGTAGPYSEEQTPKPINYYGQTKLDSEKIIENSNLPWTIIRTNVLFGNTTMQKASFVRWVTEKLSRFETISVVNDQYGNPTWSYGLAEAIAKVIENDVRGLYHYAGEDYLNRFEFALKIAEIYGLNPLLIRKTTTRSLHQIAPRPFKAGLICDKIRKVLDVPFYSISESLTRMKGNM